MTTSTADLDTAAAVLAAVRRDGQAADDLERNILQAAAQWTAMHNTDHWEEAASWPAPGGEIPISGEGAPFIAEFAVADFAAAIGVSTDAGRRYLGEAIELRYRLRRVWGRVVAGEVLAWKARFIAQHTMALSQEAATWVDRHIAPFAHSIGPVQLQRVIDEALARFMPDTAEAKRLAAAEQRNFRIGLEQAGTTGVVYVDGALDIADALDLEAAVSATAADLAAWGSQESLDVRRSMAVGEIARRDLTLDLDDEGAVGAPTAVVEVRAERASKPPHPRRAATGRQVVLYLHLTDTALTGGSNVGRCENTDTPVTVEQIRAWVSLAGRVTVKPVLDLAGHSPVDAYEIPDRHKEQVRLRDRHCVHPHCRRRARSCDCDHTTPYDPDGPPGQTCPCNLAPLCRYHHRLKTHGGWTYTTVEPGTYLWRSPYGYQFLVDPLGTTALDP